MARGLAAILACTPLGLSAAPALLPAPADLQREGVAMAREGAPLVMLFSRAGCHWCEDAKRYLAPAAREGATPPRVREIDVDSAAPLVDFAGRRTTQRAFAEAEQVKFTPTVVIYGAAGERLVEPLVGMALPDFYGAYVDRAIATARERMAAPSNPLQNQNRQRDLE